MKYGPIETCQSCDAKGLKSAMFFGFLPPVNTMREIGKASDQESHFPAELLYCQRCHLVQLGYAADPRILFPPEYPYTSGTTKILRENFADLYTESKGVVGLTPGDLVVDIGSNDGTLLGNFKAGGHRVLGIEPTLTAELARAKEIPTLMSYFTPETAAAVRSEHGAAKVVTAANVFAHIHQVHDVVNGIKTLLGPDGVFISESHYFGAILETLQYDTIYHEHLRYYSLASLKVMLESHGLRVFRVRRIPTHGGSIRVYAANSERYRIDESVANMLGEEERVGLTSDRWIEDFRRRVLRSKLELYQLLGQIHAEEKRVSGIGAPSRASTLINYAGLDDGLLDAVFEVKGSKKIGKYMPGTLIPVLDEARLYEDQPPYVLLLSWHISEELMANLRKRGFRGDFIVPLPVPKIVRGAELG